MDKLIHRVRGMVERGERLSASDCRGLFDIRNLNEFSKLSRIVRERRYGGEAFFRAAEAFPYRGEHPELFYSEMVTVASGSAYELVLKPVFADGDTFESWLERFRMFGAPGRRVVADLSAGFIAAGAETWGMKSAEILTRFRSSLPVRLTGSGAGLFNDPWRAEFAPEEISAERWLAVHQGAHEAGMRTDAWMTFRHETDPDLYVAHLETLRALQDRTGGFRAFAPTAYHDSNPDARYLATPTAATTLKVTAIARLFLDNVPHIVALPAFGDPETSYVALSYGADIVDPTVVPGDVATSSQETQLAEGPELEILPDRTPKRETARDPDAIEQRIAEARWNPVPVDSDDAPAALEEAAS